MTTEQQLPLSTSQSVTAGEGSSLSKEVSSKDSQTLVLRTRLDGLITLGSDISRVHSAKTAFKEGLTLQTAKKLDKRAVSILILTQLKRLVKAVNATRSFNDNEDMMDAVEDIIEVFPSLKVEEIMICFKYIRQGRYELYGSLNSSTLMKSLHAYEEANTIPMREQKHKAQEPYINGMIDWKQLSEALTVDQPKRSLEELGGYINVTEQDLKDIEKAKKESK
jgi:hypothetical protein